MKLVNLKKNSKEVKLSEINHSNYLCIEEGLDFILKEMEEDGIVEVREYIQVPYAITGKDFTATLKIGFYITGESNTKGNDLKIEGYYVSEYITGERIILCNKSDSLEGLYEEIYNEIEKTNYTPHYKFNSNTKHENNND